MINIRCIVVKDIDDEKNLGQSSLSIKTDNHHNPPLATTRNPQTLSVALGCSLSSSSGRPLFLCSLLLLSLKHFVLCYLSAFSIEKDVKSLNT